MTDRDLDARIVKRIFGWQFTPIPPDYDGLNQCVVLTRDGKIPEGYELPRKGELHQGFFAPQYSSDWETAIKLAKHVGLEKYGWPGSPREIAENCLTWWSAKNSPSALAPVSDSDEGTKD